MIKQVYPTPAGPIDEGGWAGDAVPDGPRRVLAHEGRSEIVLAIDLPTLVREAEWTGGVIEFVPRVGDFVASDEPLFVLRGGATSIPDRTLRAAVAFGPERTLEQDPLFAFRILVDIGLKALSPAINDPTTGVLALDQVQRLLRTVGRRHLRGEVIADASGQPRVVLTQARLGRLRHRLLPRDPDVRRGQRADCPAIAGDAREPDRDAAGPSPCRRSKRSGDGSI